MIESIVKQIQGWAKLKGDSDGTFIGNVGDRLKVSSDVRLSENPLNTVALLLEQSRFIEQANYDYVTPVYSGSDLTLEYYEDTYKIAEAVFTYTSETDWQLDVFHFLTEDDGLPLEDDDGSHLLLE